MAAGRQIRVRRGRVQRIGEPPELVPDAFERDAEPFASGWGEQRSETRRERGRDGGRPEERHGDGNQIRRCVSRTAGAAKRVHEPSDRDQHGGLVSEVRKGQQPDRRRRALARDGQ